MRAEPNAWEWLDATPFRAHVRHLMAVGDLEASVVAVVAGVSGRAVHHLLHGRPDGSVVRRICPENAARLLRITAHDVRWLEFTPVPATATAQRLAWLRRAGWSSARLAVSVGLSRSGVEALSDGRLGACSHLVALRTEAVWRAAEVAPALPPLHPRRAWAA